MRQFLASVLLALCPVLIAQQMMNNQSVIKLTKAGFSEEVIMTSINRSPGNYDTSVDGLIALKTAKVGDKVIQAMVAKGAEPTPAPPPPPPPAAMAPAPPAANFVSASVPVSPAAGPGAKPRVFLQSQSHGAQWGAHRDQSMEMSKDFEKDCPDVRISLNQSAADYTVSLNHIEQGFSRDNQIQIANRDGDLISKTREGGSINGNIKKACSLILADWAKK
jgi:hypothetical protein